VLKTHIFMSILCFGSLCTAGFASAKEQTGKDPNKTTTQEFMQSKRLHMHEVFDAVISKNFDQIVEKSRILLMLSQASTWHQVDSEEYNSFTKQFQEAVKFTIAKAEVKNIEGSAQGYVKISTACLNCHQVTRWKKK
jgi:hypothetical protein